VTDSSDQTIYLDKVLALACTNRDLAPSVSSDQLVSADAPIKVSICTPQEEKGQTTEKEKSGGSSREPPKLGEPKVSSPGRRRKTKA
jgi:hypothetical protein